MHIGIPKNLKNYHHVLFLFSRMRSEGSRFIWGRGGEAVFAESCVCVRNRSQPSATVRNRLRVRRKWRVRLEWFRKRVKLTPCRKTTLRVNFTAARQQTMVKGRKKDSVKQGESWKSLLRNQSLHVPAIKS